MRRKVKGQDSSCRREGKKVERIQREVLFIIAGGKAVVVARGRRR
jgi:hypothetical protein